LGTGRVEMITGPVGGGKGAGRTAGAGGGRLGRGAAGEGAWGAVAWNGACALACGGGDGCGGAVC
jgi:hypothetical protein